MKIHPGHSDTTFLGHERAAPPRSKAVTSSPNSPTFAGVVSIAVIYIRGCVNRAYPIRTTCTACSFMGWIGWNSLKGPAVEIAIGL